jgi:hypothetical protein
VAAWCISRLVAAILRKPQRITRLPFSSGASLEEKQAATRNIRSQFHPDGLQDRWLSDMTAGTWSTLVYELFDHSTIYVQLRYASVRS